MSVQKSVNDCSIINAQFVPPSSLLLHGPFKQVDSFDMVQDKEINRVVQISDVMDQVVYDVAPIKECLVVEQSDFVELKGTLVT